MALNEISTGYKPEFTLGGLYHGFNAANAEDLNKEELIKQYLSNQREQQAQPLDIAKLKQNQLIDQYKTSPEYQTGMTNIQYGQGKSNLAAGQLKEALLPQEITTGKQDLAHKEAMGALVARLDEMKRGSPSPTGQVGFPMQQQEQSSMPGTIGFPAPNRPADSSSKYGSSAWIVPPKVQDTNDNAAGFLNVAGRQDPSYDLAELNRALASKNLKPEQRAALLGERDRLTRGLASPAQAPNANNSPLVQQPPQRNGGITQGSPEYEQVMQALVDQPELRAKLLLGDQKLDSSEYQTILKTLAAEKLAASRVKGVGDPKTAQETMQRILAKQRRGEELTQVDYDTYNQANETLNAINAAKVQPGTQINPNIAPEVILPKPGTQQSPGLSPPGATPAPKAGGSLEDRLKAELERRAATKGK